ncbi:carbohydrate ABC transporter permease [Virgisporangium ochraceum]|uniref:carbohydrate ABC transporter permease n=1 Tax=Virgisporangium ochraceum TaxID=65505 RepID=UPI001EF1C511|nr:carbohydrate ABC transporter permease [Virgisporangium ochraceum]
MRRRRWTVGRVASLAVLVAFIAVTIFPFLWMVRTAFTPSADLFTDTLSPVPKRPTLANFERVLGLSTVEEAQAAGGSGARMNFLLYLRNSVIYTAVTVAGQVFSCAMAGYALTRLRFRGRGLVFGTFMAGLMVPPIFTLLPNFALVKDLGLLNTFGGLVAPSLLMTPFTIFFLRQFFLSIPTEVEEAAVLDGAGRWAVFWRVVLPMSRGPLLTISLTLAVWTWKDFLWPLLVAPDEGTRVLTAALSVFLQQSPNSRPDWTGLMAAATLTVVPVLVLLVVFGRRLVDSINFSGGK